MELHLTLKKKWFDMILSGEKKHEYRELKPYWINRLAGNNDDCIQPSVIIFRNGYSKNAREMTVECYRLVINTGVSEWGAEPGIEYFVFELGRIIETKNIS